MTNELFIAYLALYPDGTSSLEQTTVSLAANSSRTVYILMEQFNEVAFTFNGTIAYIYYDSVYALLYVLVIANNTLSIFS